MPEYDSPAVEALVERARNPLDAGSVHEEVARALSEMTLSKRDRGQLLLAQLVLLQGSLSADESVALADEIVQLVGAHSDPDTIITALAIAATVSASAGDKATCLERCLDISGIVRAYPNNTMSYRSAANFGAALIVLGAYDLAAPLFVDAIHASLDDSEQIGVVASCANLAMTVSRQALISGRSTVHDEENLRRLDTIDDALGTVRDMGPAPEMNVFVTTVLAQTAQLRGDLDASQERWGDLDALTTPAPEAFSQYLCLTEAPLALHRGDIDRAHRLVERAIAHLSTSHIVPLGRVDGLKIRSAIHEQTGDLTAALNDARDAMNLALAETSGLADLLIAQVDKRAALEQSQQALLDRTTHLTEQALVDELSQVGNRRAYEAQIEALRRGPEIPIAVLVCDIDQFKDVNDRFGHTAGDDVIIQAGTITSTACGDAEKVFRYGGDEFVVLPGSLSAEQASELAERIRAAFAAEAWDVGGVTIDITCSIGVWSGPSSAIEQGVAEADRLLYEAKKAGRNVVRAARPMFALPSGPSPQAL